MSLCESSTALDAQTDDMQTLRELLCDTGSVVHIARFGTILSWFGPLINTRSPTPTTLLHRVCRSAFVCCRTALTDVLVVLRSHTHTQGCKHLQAAMVLWRDHNTTGIKPVERTRSRHVLDPSLEHRRIHHHLAYGEHHVNQPLSSQTSRWQELRTGRWHALRYLGSVVRWHQA
jgi:hypothetical protein